MHATRSYNKQITTVPFKRKVFTDFAMQAF